MIQAPIFKDTFYTTLANVVPFVYHIENEDGETIFNGRAWPRPDADTLSININRICQNYLSTSIPYFGRDIDTGTTINEDACKVFYLYDANNSLLESYRFLLDWSYQDKDFTDDFLMSEPVNGHYAPGMLLMGTWWENSDKKPHTMIYTNPSAVSFDDELLYTKEACGEYAIYYQDRSGGWSSFLFEGMSTKKDDYSRYYTNNSFNNNTIQHERKSYHNEILTSYELNTGWLNDEESKRFAFNVPASNCLYLHNLCTGELQPVLVKDTSTTYKTFRNNKRELIQYTITFEESQKKQNIN